MQNIIQRYLSLALPDGIICFVQEKDHGCDVRIGTQEKMLFRTFIHHPRDIIAGATRKSIAAAIKQPLRVNAVNHALIRRIKRFEIYKSSKAKKSARRAKYVYEVQKRETESNKRRALYKEKSLRGNQ